MNGLLHPVIHLESGNSESWDSQSLKSVSPRHSKMSLAFKNKEHTCIVVQHLSTIT